MKITHRIGVFNIILGIVVVFICVWRIDNFKFYNIDRSALSIEAEKIIGDNGIKNYKITDEMYESQSLTYKFEYEGDKFGCITFIKSIYRDKWRFSDFYLSEDFSDNTIEYIPYTQKQVYIIICDKHNLYANYNENDKNRLNSNLILIAILLLNFISFCYWNNKKYKNNKKTD